MPRKAKIKIRRGLEANLVLGALEDGEFGLTTDTSKLFIGLGGQNVFLGEIGAFGDMLRSVYDTDNDGIVDWAEKVNWSGVQGKPTRLSDFANDIGAGGGIKITTAPTAPSTPSPGDFWYKEI
jgi:hypothetical protein